MTFEDSEDHNSVEFLVQDHRVALWKTLHPESIRDNVGWNGEPVSFSVKLYTKGQNYYFEEHDAGNGNVRYVLWKQNEKDRTVMRLIGESEVAPRFGNTVIIRNTTVYLPLDDVPFLTMEFSFGENFPDHWKVTAFVPSGTTNHTLLVAKTFATFVMFSRTTYNDHLCNVVYNPVFWAWVSIGAVATVFFVVIVIKTRKRRYRRDFIQEVELRTL
jgi:hypothetical protein